jgi:hypothetical protein
VWVIVWERRWRRRLAAARWAIRPGVARVHCCWMEALGERSAASRAAAARARAIARTGGRGVRSLGACGEAEEERAGAVDPCALGEARLLAVVHALLCGGAPLRSS